MATGLLAHLSNLLHMKIKDLTPRKYESIYEIAYLLFGRASIFVVSINMMVLNVGALILYYMLIGDIGSSLMINLLVGPPVDGKQASLDDQDWTVKFACNRVTQIVVVGALLLLVVFKRRLNEMKMISFLFLAIVGLFLVLLSAMAASENVSETADFDDLTRVKPSAHLVTAISIIVFAFATQFIVFPTYTELERKSTERFSTVSIISVVLLSTAYLATAVCGLLIFGAATTPDLLENVATKNGQVSLIIRLAYIVVLLFHIPYVFFAVKEYSLVMYDELQNRCLSIHLEEKLIDFYKSQEEVKKQKRREKEAAAMHLEENGFELVKSLETDKMIERDDEVTDDDSDRESIKSQMTATSVKSALTYKQLSDRVFFWVTVSLHSTILLLSILISDLTVVFDFTGGICATLMMFVFPGVGYLVALRRYGTSRIRKRRDTLAYQVVSVLLIVLGFAILGSYISVQVMKALGKIENKVPE